MYSSMCFMTIVALLVMDVRTGALQDSDIQPSRCYNCRANDTTSCVKSSSWVRVTCPAERPLCATTTVTPDFHSTLECAPVMKTPCAVSATSNTSFAITLVCNPPLCNVPLRPKWRTELINFISNSTDITQQNTSICELISNLKNNSEEHIPLRITTTEAIAAPTEIVKNSSEPISLIAISADINLHPMLRDLERPRAEPLKQQPTVPSDDDEDESEGSGTYEESRIHNHAVSAPAAPSSFLPANENKASLLYKDLLVTILFIYLVV